MINVVFACGDKKRASPYPQLRARALPTGTVHERADEWIARLDAAIAESVGLPVQTLYSGVYWSTVLSLMARADAEAATITPWVCSAGYGLIPFDATIHPYSATFTPGHSDSVPGVVTPNSGNESAAWWEVLNAWRGPVPGAPRLLAELMARSPDAALVVVAGRHYLRAIARDLRDAVATMEDPGQLVLISAGISASPPGLRGLESHLLRVDSRWINKLGGTRIALNGNLAAELLLRSDYQSNQLTVARASMEREQRTLPLHVMPRGVRQTPDEVERFIRIALQQNPKVGHSVLVRRLRGEGKAFEYKRFQKIYNKVREQPYALKD